MFFADNLVRGDIFPLGVLFRNEKFWQFSG
jgi:hypothetical protein